MTNSLHPPAALRLRVLHSQGKAPTVCSVFPMKLPGSSISATAPLPATPPQRPSQQLRRSAPASNSSATASPPAPNRTRPSYSHIQHPTPAPRPGDSFIRGRHGGGVGNRCRWVERFALSEQQPMRQQGRWALILIGAANGRTPQLRVSKSGPGAPDC